MRRERQQAAAQTYLRSQMNRSRSSIARAPVHRDNGKHALLQSGQLALFEGNSWNPKSPVDVTVIRLVRVIVICRHAVVCDETSRTITQYNFSKMNRINVALYGTLRLKQFQVPPL